MNKFKNPIISKLPRMKSILNKSLAWISVICILLSLSPISLYAADNQQDFDTVKQRVNALQATDPSLPWWVSEQKGRVGTILSRLFDSNGKIGNIFLKILGPSNDNEIMKWDASSGQMVGSSITDNGSIVWVGLPLDVDWIITTDKINVNGDFPSNGWGSMSVIRWNQSNQAIVTFTDSTSSNQRWAIGLTAWSNDFRVVANSNANLLLGSFWSQNIQLLPGTWWVGIGKSPTSALDVLWSGQFTGTVSGANPTAANNFTTKSYVDTALLWAWGGKFVDWTDSDDAVYTAGSVGIGTNNPRWALEIQAQWDDAELLRFNTERAWRFMQDDTGATSKLELNSLANKMFKITSLDRSSIAEFVTSDSAVASRISLLPDGWWVAIGKITPTESLDVVWNGQFSWTVSAADPVAATDLTTKSYVDGAITAGVAWAGDDLGNHTATENIQLSGNWLSNDGGNEWIRITNAGNVWIWIGNPNSILHVYGNWQIVPVVETTWAYWSWWGTKNPQNSWVAWMLAGTGNFSFRDESNPTLLPLLIEQGTWNVGIGVLDPTERLHVNGNIIATDPTENNHVATKVYVDNAITVASNNDINALSDAKTTVTSLYLGTDVWDLATGSNNTGIWQYSLQANTTWNNNTAFGRGSLQANTTWIQNTAIWAYSLENSTTASYNVGLGYSALFENTTGPNNVAIWRYALFDNTTWNWNVAIGRSALANNTTRWEQVAIWYLSQNNTTTGYANVAVGWRSLQDNTTWYVNVAVWQSALANNTTGAANTAVWHNALVTSTGASSNTALWYYALRLNTTGTLNTAVWRDALSANTTWNSNIAVWAYSLDRNTTWSYNAGVWYGTLFANTTWVANIAMWHVALDANTTWNHNIWIWYIALTDNITWNYNVALWSYNLQTNTTGSNNTALWYHNLRYNTTWVNNTAVWYAALDASTTASNNAALGFYALSDVTTWAQNTALGTTAVDSVTTGNYNTWVWYNTLGAVTTGQYNTAIGWVAGDNITTGDSNIIIWYGIDAPSATASNQLNIGNTIYGSLSSDRVGVGTNNFVAWLTVKNDLGISVDATTSWGFNGNIRMVDALANTTSRDDMQFSTPGWFMFKMDAGDNWISSVQWFNVYDGADNSVFAIEESNGNVGIGTTSPSAKLDVVGTAEITWDIRVDGDIYGGVSGTNGIWRYSTLYPNYWLFYTDVATDYVSISPNGWGSSNPVMKIQWDGNVGIGNTSPSQKLDVTWNGNFSGTVTAATPTAATHLTTKSYVDSAISSGWADNLGNHSATTTLDMNNNLVQQVRWLFMWWSNTYWVQFNHGLFSHDGVNYSDDMLLNSYGNVRINIDSNNNDGAETFEIGNHTTNGTSNTFFTVNNTGNVGIGDATPDTKLHIADTWDAILTLEADTDNITETDNPSIIFKQDGWVVNWRIWFASGTNDLELMNQNNYKLALGTNNTEKLTILGNGNVGIGDTTPTYKLDVNGTGRFTWTVIGATPTAATHLTTKSYVDSAINTSGWNYIAINSTWDQILDNTVDSSEIQNNSLTASDLAENSVGNSELIDAPTFTNITITATPTATTHATNKAYVDNLVTQWVSWKAPVDTSAAATYGACDAAKEWWATYNKSDDIIYLCNASAWVNIGNSASVPYATTSTAGRVQLSGDIGGTWNNLQIGTAVVWSAEIANNAITETDISDAFVARNSNLLDGIDSSWFLRSNINDNLTAAIIVPDANRDQWIFWSYNSSKTQHIWSMWTAYRNAADGSDFGNLYGLAYKHTNNTTWWAMAGSHQVVWNVNWVPKAAMWNDGLWTSSRLKFGATPNQAFVGDGSSAIYLDSNNSSISQMIFRDLQDDQFGRVYGSQWDYFGLMDGDWNWAVQHLKDTHTMFAINNVEKARITNDGLSISNVWTSADVEAIKVWVDGETWWSLKFFDDDAESSQNYKLSFGAWTQDLKFHSDQVDNVLYMTETGNVGIWTASPSAKLQVNGTIIASTPTASNHLTTKAYVDGAIITSGWNYIAIGSSWDQIQDGTIDSSEIQDNTLTAADLATDSVWAAELWNNSVASANIIDGQVTTSDIANNTITETDISDSFIARNSNLLDGFNTATAATASTVAVRDGSRDIFARLFRSDYPEQWTPAATADIAFRNSTSDNYIRFMTRDGARAYLGVTTNTDTQDLSISGRTISLTNGWSVTVPSSNTDTQNLSLATSTDVLSLTNGWSVDFTYLRDGDIITDGTVDSSEIQDNTLTASDLAANSVWASEIATNAVWNAEMIDNPAFTNVQANTITANSFVYSDKRLKRNFQPINTTDKILSLGTYRFDWKKDGSSDIWFIAQEVKEIYPEFVRKNDDGYLTVDYARMVVPLLEVTKKQQAEIDELRSMIQELQNK